MYAKLFSSIYQGTLRGNTNGLVVFTNMLAHADSAGWVDIHPRAIAEETGLTVEQVRASITELSSPDPESRSPEEGGRRIVLIDDHRDWGWRIVNHAKYRSIRSEEDRREQNRLAQQRFRERHNSKQSKPRKPMSAQAEAEAEAEANLELSKDNSSSATPPTVSELPKIPDCPHAKLIALFCQRLPELPAPKVELWDGTSAKNMRARWRWLLTAKKASGARYATDEESAIAWMDRFFSYVARSDFLMGRVGGFQCSLQWLMNSGNFAKVLQGNYDNRAAA